MAKTFYGQDELTGQPFTYVYGRLNQHAALTIALDHLLNGKSWTECANQAARKWLVDGEEDLLSSEALSGYEFLVCPFTDGKTIKNLPFLRMVFKSGNEYVRKYDDFSPVRISEHNADRFLNPLTKKRTVQIVRIEESV